MKGRRNMKMEVIHGSRTVPKAEQQALLVSVSQRMIARNEHARERRRAHRLQAAPERSSVARAADAVEERLVRAFWTIARQPLGGASPYAASRCGLEYVHDRADIYARYADAPGNKWESEDLKPGTPSSKEITASNVALDWPLLIDDEALRRLLVVVATTKRGDVRRRVSWERIRPQLASMKNDPQRTLQWRYKEALRIIVSELTIARLAPQC